MSKKKNKSKKANKQQNQVRPNQAVVVSPENANLANEVNAEAKDASAENSTKTDAKTDANKGKNKVVEVKAKDVAKKNKKNKVKQPNKFVKAIKNTGGELKKVTWPKFKEVVKQTGIVLVVVIVFTLVIFGLDSLCSWLTGLLVK